VHIFGPRSLYPLAEDRVFAPGLATVDDVVALHDKLGIQRLVVVQASPQGLDNRCVLDSLDLLHAKGREARAVVVLPRQPLHEELERMHAVGVRGVRVNLASYGRSDPASAAVALQEAADTAAVMGWHVQMYTTVALVATIANTIRQLPVPLVLDHFGLAMAVSGVGQQGFSELLSLVREGHVYVKLSAPYRIIEHVDGRDAEPIARALIDSNAERMLWGTDWPHTGPWPGMPREREGAEPFHPVDDGQQMDIVASWTTPDEWERILVQNPARLYGFGDGDM